MSTHISTPRRQYGINLIELMIAMAIGVFLLLGLSTVFVNSSKTQRELEYTGQLIENGRFATDMVYQDVRHAGAYGYMVSLGIATAVPDACSTTIATLQAALEVPLQGFDATDASTKAVPSTSCASGLLPPANLKAGSDILVVRRANTGVAGSIVSGEVYVQSDVETSTVYTGGGTAPTLTYVDGTTADSRLLENHIYFVAPCTIGLGTNGVCNGSASEDDVPALKRLHLTGGSFAIEPLVEGVEYFQVEYAIDSSPTAEDSTTGEAGDGIPDSYVALPTTLEQWSQVVAVRIYMLVRSVKASKGYTDEKSYTLGSATAVTVSAANDAFKRHVFSLEAQIANIAGRREIPL